MDGFNRQGQLRFSFIHSFIQKTNKQTKQLKALSKRCLIFGEKSKKPSTFIDVHTENIKCHPKEILVNVLISPR